MVRDSESGYSPAQLIDRLPAFASLSAEQRDGAKKKMHAQFLQEFEIERRERQMRAVIDSFGARLEEFLRPHHGLSEDSRDAHAALDAATRDLIRELHTLPSGVWLWPDF